MNETRNSLPKTRRLTLSSQFARVRIEGHSVRGSFLILGFLPVGGERRFQVGFITSKRIGNAVVRNRIRRRLREIVRTHQAALKTGIWFVLVARPAAARANHRDLKDEWLRLAERASILAP